MAKASAPKNDINIDKQKFDGFFSSLNLDNLEFVQLNYRKLKNPEPEKYNNIAVNFNAGQGSYQNNMMNDFTRIIIFQDFNFELLEYNNDKQDDKQAVFQLNTSVVFILRSKNPMDDELFGFFQKRNIPIIIHPYLRETIAGALYKAGLPPLLLPLYHNQF
jgi:hypothetical protein